MKKIFTLLLTLVIISCSDKKNENENNITELESELESMEAETFITCLWEKVSVRKTPEDKGKFLTSLYLGETATFLGEKIIDEKSSKKSEFLKVRLTDGKEGWVQSKMVGLDVKPAGIIQKTKVYKRPDILTATDKEFDRMQFLVNSESKGEWIKVKGKRKGDSWFTEGWIKNDKISTREEDVTVVILVQKANATKEATKGLKEIIDNSDLENSTFITDIKEQLGLGPKDFADKGKVGVINCWLSDASMYPRSTEAENEEGSAPEGLMLNGKEYYLYVHGINGLFYDYVGSGLITCMNNMTKTGRDNYDLKNSVMDFSNGINPYEKEFKYDYESGGATTENKFNYINPKIVTWAYSNLIPDPDSEILGEKAKVIYDKIFSRFFRMMTKGYFYTNYTLNIEEVSGYYLNAMQKEKFDGISYLEANYGNSYDEMVSGQLYYDDLQDFMVVGFWMRRHLDGSINEVWKGLEMGMNLYDKEWMEKEKVEIEAQVNQ